MRRIDRPRLIHLLRARHRMSLTVLEAPPGFGITTVLEQALAQRPAPADAIDLQIVGDRSLSGPGALTAAILAGLGSDPEAGTDAIIAALEARPGPVAVVIDDFELTTPAGPQLCNSLLASGSERVHLVLAGRRIPDVRLSRWVAAGSAVQIQAAELAFRPEEVGRLFAANNRPGPADGEVASWPALAGLLVADRGDLLGPYLRERVLPQLTDEAAVAVAVMAVTGGCPLDGIGTVLSAARGVGPGDGPGRGDRSVGVAGVLDELAQVPLVEIDAHGCWPHPLWLEATAGLVPPEARSRALVARIDVDRAETTVREVAAAATRWRDRPALIRVVRAALSSDPPRASVSELRAWSDTGLLDGGPEADWLAGALSMRTGGSTAHALGRLEAARRQFERAGDVDAEIAVMLQLGMVARGRDDLATMTRLLDRASELAHGGQAAAAALVALGQAVSAQMAGDPIGALHALQEVPVGALAGEWATQVLLVCGTNLTLAGRPAEAAAVLEVAAGSGTAAARAIASDLLSAARWSSGDRAGAIRAARAGVGLAEEVGLPAVTTTTRTALACMLASIGRADEAEALLDRVAGAMPSGEAGALAEIGRVLLAAARRDLESARQRLETLGPPLSRPTRSSLWRAALETGLLPDSATGWADLAEKSPPYRSAVAAGRAWAEALRTGQPVPERWRPYIPDTWCRATGDPVRIRLLGECDVELWGGGEPSRAWARPRVRELCLHLALCHDAARDTVAARLWPDLDQKAAGTNLRVTLSHLLDVLEPGRARGAGSSLVLHDHGPLTFNRRSVLRVDIWEVADNARAVLAADADERPAIVAAARRMVESGTGRFLGGGHCGEWVDSYRRHFDADVIQAAVRAAPIALELGDHGLAAALADRVLDLDPWSEEGHRLLVSARLAGGDIDAARRAREEGEQRLAEIGATPSAAFRAVARRVYYRSSPTD